MSEKKVRIKIDGMTCVSCVKSLESVLEKMQGVSDASVHFASDDAVIQYNDQEILEQDLVQVIQDSGYGASLFSKRRQRTSESRQREKDFRNFLIAALLTLPFLLQMVGMIFGFGESLPGWMQWILASIVLFYSGRKFFINSYHALKVGSANMDVLIALGTSVAYLFSTLVLVFSLNQPLYFETTAMIITLVLLGRWLESRSKGQASEAIQKLVRLQPKFVKIKKGNDFRQISIEEVQKKDVLLVSVGETVPVDGIVVGESVAIEESLLTGESLPVQKEKGDLVFAATQVVDGVLYVEAAQIGEGTVLSEMIRLVEMAQHSKAPIQKWADKVSEVFVPAVLACSLLTWIGWIFVTGSFTEGLIPAVSVLIIACPCALGLATPTVIMVGSGLAAEMGMLFREAAALEHAQKLEVMFLDKTGTLTEGRPYVRTVRNMNGFEKSQVIEVAASLENNSGHPIAKAIVQYAREQKIPIESVSDFKNFTGKGVIGTLSRNEACLGSPSFAKEKGAALDRDVLLEMEQQGSSIVVIWNSEHVMGYIAIRDRLRKGSKQLISELKKRKIKPVMITGDHNRSAHAIADELEIEEVYANLRPKEKTEQIKKASSSGAVVGMAGDGVNDAAALAAADVGFAFDSGSDIAMESADITLMGGDPMGIVRAIDLSKAVFVKMKQNLLFAFGYNALAIPLAAIGLLNPIIAAVAMSLSSISVVSNAVLLKRWRWKKP